MGKGGAIRNPETAGKTTCRRGGAAQVFIMRALPTVVFSPTREDLLAQIDSVHEALVEFFREVPAEFLLSAGDPDGWSVAKNMGHIASTNRLMAHYIGMPTILLLLMGRPPREQPTVEDLRPTNRPHMHDYGCYHRGRSCRLPRRERALLAIANSAEALKRAVLRRTDEELDRFRGPFGGLSLRLFVHFVLKHNVHHANVVRTRLKADAEQAAIGEAAPKGREIL